jgi:hypothetical protein
VRQAADLGRLPRSRLHSAHFDAVATIGDAVRLASYQILFVDSLTAASRLSFTHAEQQPESFNERGRKVVLVAVLERVTDEFNHSEWQPQIEGSKTSRELPGIVDQLVTMQFIDFGDGLPVRAFVCTSPNPWLYPAKDRSGKLEQVEEPHLGKLITKLSAKPMRLIPPAADAATAAAD